MNRRVLLAFGAAAVLAAVIILIVALRTEDGVEASPRGGDVTSPPHGDGTGRTSRVPRDQRVAETGSAVRETIIDGARVRDHRTGAGSVAEPAVQPPPPRADGRTLPPAVTRDVGTKLQTVIARCAAAIPTQARGKDARLEGTISVAIKDHQLKVLDATLDLKQVESDQVTTVKQCIEQKSTDITTQVPDEADVDSYAVVVSLAL